MPGALGRWLQPVDVFAEIIDRIVRALQEDDVRGSAVRPHG